MKRLEKYGRSEEYALLMAEWKEAGVKGIGDDAANQ